MAMFVERTSFPDRCYHTILYTKNDNPVALAILNKCVKYLSNEEYLNKYRDEMIYVMDIQLQKHTIPVISYDKREYKLMDMKEFRKEDTPYPIFFVDPDTMVEYDFNRDLYFGSSGHRKVVTRFYKNRNIDFSQPYTSRDKEFFNTKLNYDSRYMEETEGKKKYKYMIKNEREKEWIDKVLNGE